MKQPVRAAFEQRVVCLKLQTLIPMRELEPRERKEQKYRQIEASLSAVGLVEPLVVFREGKDKYRVLDGLKRLDILTRQNVAEVKCLIALDDEAFTYNKRVNYLSSVGEHQMILRALKHNSEAAIAKALAVNVRTIRKKRDLLDGICTEAIELLKDRRISLSAFIALKKMKPIRQVEVAQLMITSNRYSQRFAEALLAGTPSDMLVEPERNAAAKNLSPGQRAHLERETHVLLQDLKAAQITFGVDALTLSISCRYVSRILANTKVRPYIEGRFPDILAELESVITSVQTHSAHTQAVGAQEFPVPT
jgi:ParB-like chromosome segregation protein Spo0J